MIQAYEDQIELDLERLEAVALSPTSADFSSYPYPRLELSGHAEKLTFRTLVIENSHIKLAVAPDLGGRIVELIWKASSSDLAKPFRPLAVHPLRGVSLGFGLEVGIWNANGQNLRRNALGPVEVQLMEPEEEGDPAFIDLYELASGVGVAWRLRLGLGEDSEAVGVEFRVHSRIFEQADVDFGLVWTNPGLEVVGELEVQDTEAKRMLPGLAAWGTDVWTAELRHARPEPVVCGVGLDFLKQSSPRAAGYVLMAASEFAQDNPAGAADYIESALLFSGDHPLLWWLKAVAHRLSGELSGDELLNAHFLAPGEPCLRAESFLGNNHQTKEPSPLVAPLADNPGSMLEVACLLLEVGLPSQAHQWIDECLRHREIPMLRYLMAYAHLKFSGMRFEAADQVGRASRVPINPPYPWRRTERIAVETLQREFPKDARLADLAAMIARAGLG